MRRSIPLVQLPFGTRRFPVLHTSGTHVNGHLYCASGPHLYPFHTFILHFGSPVIEGDPSLGIACLQLSAVFLLLVGDFYRDLYVESLRGGLQRHFLSPALTQSPK